MYLKRITLKSKISGNYTQFFKTLEMQSQTTSFPPPPQILAPPAKNPGCKPETFHDQKIIDPLFSYDKCLLQSFQQNTAFCNFCCTSGRKYSSWHICKAFRLNTPPMTTRQVEKNVKCIGGNKATSQDGFGIKIIKLPLPAISQSIAKIYYTSFKKAAFPNNFRKSRLIPV